MRPPPPAQLVTRTGLRESGEGDDPFDPRIGNAISPNSSHPGRCRARPSVRLGAVSHGIVGVVAVLTVRTGETVCGITISSLTPVSFDPPLVVVAIRESSRIRAVLADAPGFGISVLAADQETTARHFASRRRPTGRRQFDGFAIHPGPVTGSPLLNAALGWLDCRTFRITPTGDHALVIGEVADEVRNGFSDATPLLHGPSGYHRLHQT